MKIQSINSLMISKKKSEIPPFMKNSCQPIKPEVCEYKYVKKENSGKPIIFGFLTGVLLTLGTVLCLTK